MSRYLVGVIIHGCLEGGIRLGDRHAFAGFHREVRVHGIEGHVLAGHASEQDGRPLLGQ